MATLALKPWCQQVLPSQRCSCHTFVCFSCSSLPAIYWVIPIRIKTGLMYQIIFKQTFHCSTSYYIILLHYYPAILLQIRLFVHPCLPLSPLKTPRHLCFYCSKIVCIDIYSVSILPNSQQHLALFSTWNTFFFRFLWHHRFSSTSLLLLLSLLCWILFLYHTFKWGNVLNHFALTRHY